LSIIKLSIIVQVIFSHGVKIVGDLMKIKFTDSEIYDILRALEDNFCTDSEESIKQYNMIVKKFKSAESRSRASLHKIKHIHLAEHKKQLEHDNEIRDSFAKALRESRKKHKEAASSE
jgi:hypothetical protein